MKWLIKIYHLYMKGAKANHFPIKRGLMREKEWKPKPRENENGIKTTHLTAEQMNKDIVTVGE